MKLRFDISDSVWGLSLRQGASWSLWTIAISGGCHVCDSRSDKAIRLEVAVLRSEGASVSGEVVALGSEVAVHGSQVLGVGGVATVCRSKLLAVGSQALGVGGKAAGVGSIVAVSGSQVLGGGSDAD